MGVKLNNRVPNNVRELGRFKCSKKGLEIFCTFYSLQEF